MRNFAIFLIPFSLELRQDKTLTEESSKEILNIFGIIIIYIANMHVLALISPDYSMV